MRRGAFACVRQRPQLAFPRVVAPPNGPNATRFSTLNASQRTSTCARSFKLKIRATEALSEKFGQLRNFGLYRVALPNELVGCAGKKDCGWRKLSLFGS